jgi:hypothetical protein
LGKVLSGSMVLAGIFASLFAFGIKDMLRATALGLVLMVFAALALIASGQRNPEA